MTIHNELHENAEILFEILNEKAKQIHDVLLDEPTEEEEKRFCNIDEVTAVVKAYIESVDEYVDAVDTYVHEVADAFGEVEDLINELDDIIRYSPSLDGETPDPGDVVNVLNIPF